MVIPLKQIAKARHSAIAAILLAPLLVSTAYSQCDLTVGPGLNLGPTDPSRLKSTGEVKMAFLFVDFPDAPANEDPEALYDALVPFAQEWVKEVSSGRAMLAVTPFFRWFRMPNASGEYNFARGLTFDLHKQYIADAVAVADGVIDFSQFDGAYILASRDADVPFSPTWVPNPGFGIEVDDIELRHVITLGRDTRAAIPIYRWHVIQHETGHLWGLPDLYLFAGTDIHTPVGTWDNMGLITLGAHFVAWQKKKLGWLTADEFACVTEQSRVIGLSPLENESGIRGLAIPTGPSTAIVAEVRRPIGQDTRLCDQGLLVYTVDSLIASGQGPMVVQRAVPSTDPALINQCGPGYNATFDLERGKPTVFEHSATGITIEALALMADGGVSVRVTNPGSVSASELPGIAAVIGAGAFGASRTVAPGQWIEIYGQNLAQSTRSWSEDDFSELQAPESLDGVQVTLGGKPAYVAFIDGQQVNVQVPDGIGPGNLPAIVSNAIGVSAPFIVAVQDRAPGLLAPASFSTASLQYVVALHVDQTFVGPEGLIPGTPFRRAVPGDTVVMYGVGFGATNPFSPAGQIIVEQNALPNVDVRFGERVALIRYAGLALGLVGLYQFNVEVPPGVAGDVPLSVIVDGVEVDQDLWLAVL